MRKRQTLTYVLVSALLSCGFLVGEERRRAERPPYLDWGVYGGGLESIRYSALDQINRNNVHLLQRAWAFDTGDAFPGSQMECNPIVVNGVLYATTPKVRVVALNAETGRLQWSFDPNAGNRIVGAARNRGVTYWEDQDDQRIFFVARHFLYSLDARTGRPVITFGEKGRIDLRKDLGRDPQTISIWVTSPGIVYKDFIILGSMVTEDFPSAPGDIRAYDVRSGKLRWTFHTIPRPGEFGYNTWPKHAWTYASGANCWAGLSLDEKRGIVFVPTGSAAFDFYGANRIGDNLFANCLLALKADTGERLWHFQIVKHDVWDRDLPAPPSLVTVKRYGRVVDAVAQVTKSGHVFVFDRETGKPLFPIEYRRFPPSDVDGEVLAKTQPIPLKPPPFARQILTESILTRRTPEAYKAALARLQNVRSGGQFTPLSFDGTVVFPGTDGGAEWGGAAFDPATRILYVNSNDIPYILKLIPRPKVPSHTSSRKLYLGNCANCHREDFTGAPPDVPSLTNLGEQYTELEITSIIRDGSARMPSFRHLGSQTISAVARYLLRGEETDIHGVNQSPSPAELKYTNDGYPKFLDPDGYPAVEPPWGTLNAISLDSGEIVWEIPLGQFPELAQPGLPDTGCENYGGPVVTAGGLLFIGATIRDRKFRAFDKLTGKLLWETTLPAAGNATPAVYEVNGRQFIVIAAGGRGRANGGTYVAFALPKEAILRHGAGSPAR